MRLLLEHLEMFAFLWGRWEKHHKINEVFQCFRRLFSISMQLYCKDSKIHK